MFWIKSNICFASIALLLGGCTNEKESVLARFPIYEQCVPAIQVYANKLEEYRAADAGDAAIQLQFFTMKSEAHPSLVGMGTLTGTLVTDAFITTEIQQNGIESICLPHSLFTITNNKVGMQHALAEIKKKERLGISSYVSLDDTNITIHYNSGRNPTVQAAPEPTTNIYPSANNRN